MLKDAIMLMEQEKKVRLQPRHLMAGAVINGLIPRAMIQFKNMSVQENQEFERLFALRK